MSFPNPPHTPRNTGSGIYAINTVCRLLKPIQVRLAVPSENRDLDRVYTLQAGARVTIRDVEPMLTTGSDSHMTSDNAGYRIYGTLTLTREVREGIFINTVPHRILVETMQSTPSPALLKANFVAVLKEPFEFNNNRFPGAPASGKVTLPKGTKVILAADAARTLKGSLARKVADAYYTVSRLVPQQVTLTVTNPPNARITSDFLGPA